MSEEHLLIRAAKGEQVERTPVWAMRQAGRWDPEFLRVRAGMSFYEFSENVERAAAGTLCPRRFGVDGIILFYDITTLPYAMGLPFDLVAERGPVPRHPIRTREDVEALDPQPDPSRYQHIVELLRTVKGQLDGALPVLAFAGAPFTVAAYCIDTGKDMNATRQFAAEHPEVWEALLAKLQTATIGFLNVMIAEGAALYQLFDSWAGGLTPREYDLWAQPHHAAILAAAADVPRILFVKENPFLERMLDTGADVISLGKRHNLAECRRRWPDRVFQGNLNEEILRSGTPAEVEAATRACLQAGGGHRHILNLNHGVDRGTPVENFEAFIRTAHEFTF